MHEFDSMPVYTWHKSLAKEMCQKCSDRVGAPVLRSKYGCTKTQCKWDINRQPHVQLSLSLPLPNPAPVSEKSHDEVENDKEEDEHNNYDKSNDKEDEERNRNDREDSSSDDGEKREDIYELEAVLGHRVVSNKDGSNPQDQYQVS